MPGLRTWATIIYNRDYQFQKRAKFEITSPLKSRLPLPRVRCFMSADKHHIRRVFLGVSWSNQLEIEGTFIPDLLLLANLRNRGQCNATSAGTERSERGRLHSAKTIADGYCGHANTTHQSNSTHRHNPQFNFLLQRYLVLTPCEGAKTGFPAPLSMGLATGASQNDAKCLPRPHSFKFFALPPFLHPLSQAYLSSLTRLLSPYSSFFLLPSVLLPRP